MLKKKIFFFFFNSFFFLSFLLFFFLTCVFFLFCLVLYIFLLLLSFFSSFFFVYISVLCLWSYLVFISSSSSYSLVPCFFVFVLNLPVFVLIVLTILQKKLSIICPNQMQTLRFLYYFMIPTMTHVFVYQKGWKMLKHDTNTSTVDAYLLLLNKYNTHLPLKWYYGKISIEKLGCNC